MSAPFSYRPFDRNTDPEIDTNAATHVVAQVLEAALRKEGHVASVIPKPDGIKSTLEVTGLPVEGYEAWTLIDGIVTELPDEVWILKEE